MMKKESRIMLERMQNNDEKRMQNNVRKNAE